MYQTDIFNLYLPLPPPPLPLLPLPLHPSTSFSLFLSSSLLPKLLSSSVSVSVCIFNMLIVASESCFATSGSKQFFININDPVQPRQTRFLIYFSPFGMHAGVESLISACFGG